MPSICVTPSMVWEAIKLVVPTILSTTALIVVLVDRHPRIALRSKVGDWCKFRTALRGSEVIFMGVIEVYNRSSHANAIRAYGFEYRAIDGTWRPMESEQYLNKGDSTNGADGAGEIFNQTALTLAPYSAQEVRVQAIATMGSLPSELPVRIEVEDLFGQKYKIELKATR